MAYPDVEHLVEPLGAEHDRSNFSSGITALDEYLQHRANQDKRGNVTVPFVLLRRDDPRVLGYYTLSACAVRLAELPSDLTRRLPHYPVVPTTLLGRLAVDQRCRGQGLGEFLLMDALFRSSVHAQEVASYAVVVSAKNEAARSFYQKYGFQALSDNENRLFLPMSTISGLFV
ncbi:MAG: GNAT family N-acetyltransferase [Candidatus Bipolaricaulota bacterium]